MILLDKDVYINFFSGDGVCMGCSEKTILHLFIATVDSLMQPRIAKHIAHITDLIEKLERHIESKLVQNINIDDTDTVSQAIKQIGEGEITLASIAKNVESLHEAQPIDPRWLKQVVGLIESLKQLKWKYTDGLTGKDRNNINIINATDCSSV